MFLRVSCEIRGNIRQQLLASAPEHPKDMNPCIRVEHPDQLTPSEVMDIVTDAIEEAKTLFPVIKARLILCCIAPMPEISEDVARLAVKYKSKGLCLNHHSSKR